MGRFDAGDVGGDVEISEVGRDQVKPGNDAVGRDKIINVHEEHHHYGDDKKHSPVFIPRLIPFLANRVDQELRFGESIRQHDDFRQPFLCVIHGEENECSDIFVERIMHNDSLKKIILKQKAHDIKSYLFSCDTFKSREELHRKMQAGLAKQISGDLFASPEEMAATLAMQDCPIILCATLSSSDFAKGKGIQNIQHFLEFWKNWPVCKQQNHLLIICLCFNYKPVKTGFFARLLRKKSPNQIICDYFKKLDFAKFNLNGVVLPKLKKIEQDQVEDWARIHLNHIYEKLKPKIRELFDENRQAIAMEPLAVRLEQMLREVTET